MPAITSAADFVQWTNNFLTGRDEGLTPVDVQLIRDTAALTLLIIAGDTIPPVIEPTDGA